MEDEKLNERRGKYVILTTSIMQYYCMNIRISQPFRSARRKHMKLKHLLIVSAIVLAGLTNQKVASAGVVVGVSIPVPVVAVEAPVAVAPIPFFYGGFWWWNDGGYWHRSHYEHGPWGHPYRGRIPDGVTRYHHEHFGDRHDHYDRHDRYDRHDHYDRH